MNFDERWPLVADLPEKRLAGLDNLNSAHRRAGEYHEEMLCIASRLSLIPDSQCKLAARKKDRVDALVMLDKIPKQGAHPRLVGE